MERVRVHPTARWFDVKYLVKKFVGVDRMFVIQVQHNDWDGWIVEFGVDVDLDEIKRNIGAVVKVGKRAVFIGVDRG